MTGFATATRAPPRPGRRAGGSARAAPHTSRHEAGASVSRMTSTPAMMLLPTAAATVLASRMNSGPYGGRGVLPEVVDVLGEDPRQRLRADRVRVEPGQRQGALGEVAEDVAGEQRRAQQHRARARPAALSTPAAAHAVGQHLAPEPHPGPGHQHDAQVDQDRGELAPVAVAPGTRARELVSTGRGPGSRPRRSRRRPSAAAPTRPVSSGPRGGLPNRLRPAVVRGTAVSASGADRLLRRPDRPDGLGRRRDRRGRAHPGDGGSLGSRRFIDRRGRLGGHGDVNARTAGLSRRRAPSGRPVRR